MKKALIFAAILTLVLGLAACGKTAPQTPDTQTDISDKTAATAFNEMMDAVYNVQAGTAGSSLRAEEAAKALTDYAMTYGAGSASGAFEVLAEEWFAAQKNADDTFRSDFKLCLDAAADAAEAADENLQYDIAFLNVLNGITAAAE